MDYLSLYFHDEAPAFGCGWRKVLVVSEGPKWVTMLDPSDCSAETIEARSFGNSVGYDRIVKSAKTLDLNEDAMRARLLRNAEGYGRFGSAVREALLALGADPKDLPQALGTTGPVVMTGGTGADEPETPHEGEGSGKFVQRLWMTGKYDPDQLVALVLACWPGRKTKRSDVYFNYNLLIKAGVPDVPPWPAKK